MSICYQLPRKGGFISYKNIPSQSFSNVSENFKSIFSVFYSENLHIILLGEQFSSDFEVSGTSLTYE